MFDWFQKHKWLGVVLMSLLLVTMGVSFAMIEVLGSAFGDEDTSGIAFLANGRSHLMQALREMQDNVGMCTRITGRPSIVSAGRETGIDEREACIRLILLDIAQENEINVSEYELDEVMNQLKEVNQTGLQLNLRNSRRSESDVRRFFREEVSLARLLGYEVAGAQLAIPDLVAEIKKTEIGRREYGWTQLSLARTRAEVTESLESELYEFFQDNRDDLQTAYQVGAEWILTRVEVDDSEEAVTSFHQNDATPELKEQPLEEVRDQVLAAMMARARERADAAIGKVNEAMQEEGMAAAPMAEILEKAKAIGEGAFDDLYEIGSTERVLDEADLPDVLQQCNFARSARAVAAEGGILNKLVGIDENSRGIAFYISTRNLGRVDSKPISFEELKADGYEPLLRRYYETDTARYQKPEIRTVDIAVASFATFQEKGRVDDEAIEKFYEDYKQILYVEAGGDVTSTKPLEEVRADVETRVRKRDAIAISRFALEDLLSMMVAAPEAQLLDLAADSLVKVYRIPIDQRDNTLERAPGVEFIPEADRTTVHRTAFGLTADAIEAGQASDIADLPTFSLIVKVVDREESEKAPLDAALRSRLLDDFISDRTFEKFRERVRTLQTRMNELQPGAESPDDWTEEERERWQHVNRTRFSEVAAGEEMEVEKTDRFYGEADDEVPFLSDLDRFDDRRNAMTLDRNEMFPRLPFDATASDLPEDYYMVAVLRTEPVPDGEIKPEQLDRVRGTLTSERQTEARDALLKLSKLKDRPGVDFEPRAQVIRDIDFSAEEEDDQPPGQ